MAVSVAQRVQYAWAAGFRNTPALESLSIIVAISLAECGVGSASGCEFGCVPDCCPAAPSCGLLQIYQPAHPGTTACASDPACVFTLGWSISNHGTGFGAWSTYTSGAFRSHLDAVRAAIAGLPGPIGGGGPPPVGVCPDGWALGGDGVCYPIGQTPPPSPGPPPPSPSGGSVAVAALLVGAAIVAGGVWWERRNPGAVHRLEERVMGHPEATPLFATGGAVRRAPGVDDLVVDLDHPRDRWRVVDDFPSRRDRTPHLVAIRSLRTGEVRTVPASRIRRVADWRPPGPNGTAHAGTSGRR